ncbi:hypothetical protein COV18_02445 [Candidatus Woesearchaeota archaeon CG10_big_fil_rev_8_21_14_0_10_37_12]|nr:MAG: hypothetical protein COV18_02445 [Candidatus Woesearchaeota archaeon CG10_big_fil_rev_8_21_14_0_10_37_12]
MRHTQGNGATGLEPVIEQLDKATIDDPETVISALNEITAGVFGKPVPYQETVDRFREAELIFLVRDPRTNKIAGYSFNDRVEVEGKTANYFGSGFIHPESQGGGWYHTLNDRRIAAMPANVLITRTQNPIVYAGMAALAKRQGYKLSPTPDGELTSSGLAIARAKFPECDDSMVCRGVYGRELMARTPEPKKPLASLFERIDISRGDGFVLVAEKAA